MKTKGHKVRVKCCKKSVNDRHSIRGHWWVSFDCDIARDAYTLHSLRRKRNMSMCKKEDISSEQEGGEKQPSKSAGGQGAGEKWGISTSIAPHNVLGEYRICAQSLWSLVETEVLFPSLKCDVPAF